MIHGFLYRHLYLGGRNGLTASSLNKAFEFERAPSDGFLAGILRYATRHVPFYRDIAGGTEVTPDALSRFPVLTKRLIRENFDDMKADGFDTRPWHYTSTGGSTGAPLRVIQDNEFHAWLQASEEFYHRRFVGIPGWGTRKVVLWGSRHEIFGQKRPLEKTVRLKFSGTTLLNSYRITPADRDRFVATIQRVKPVMLRGYAITLYEIACHVEKHNLRIPRPRVVVSAAETLPSEWRAKIAEVFGAPVFNFYASREAGAVAGQCSHGNMHALSFNVHAEIVDDEGNPVQPGTEGRVLVTLLHNRAMPLIRYEIGDRAIAGAGCACGSPLPVILELRGRISEHFLRPDGTLIYCGYFRQLIFNAEWVDEYQFVQTDYDTVEIYYVPRREPSAAELADIEAKVRLAMGEKCRIAWNRVNEVPRTPMGKYLHTRCLIQR
jgi:phenylacetate-CoA ligase